jgi:hypothetical protein
VENLWSLTWNKESYQLEALLESRNPGALQDSHGSVCRQLWLPQFIVDFAVDMRRFQIVDVPSDCVLLAIYHLDGMHGLYGLTLNPMDSMSFWNFF